MHIENFIIGLLFNFPLKTHYSQVLLIKYLNCSKQNRNNR